jgi:hypothetical protein
VDGGTIEFDDPAAAVAPVVVAVVVDPGVADRVALAPPGVAFAADLPPRLTAAVAGVCGAPAALPRRVTAVSYGFSVPIARWLSVRFPVAFTVPLTRTIATGLAGALARRGRPFGAPGAAATTTATLPPPASISGPARALVVVLVRHPSRALRAM